MRAHDVSEFEEIVAACVDRIERGRATVEECLAEYPPDMVSELEPSLRAAARLAQVSVPSIAPDAVLRIEERLLARAAALQHPQDRRARRLAWGGLFTRLAINGAIVIVVIALGGGGFLAVSANSLPGSPLYSVKRATETLQLSLITDPGRQAALHATFGLRRLHEAVQLNRRDNRWDFSTLRDMEREFAEAAGKANAGVVWEHIAEATANGEKELEESEGDDEMARTAADALRRLNARANLELGRSGRHNTQESEPTPPTPAPTPEAAATLVPGQADGTARIESHATDDNRLAGDRTQEEGKDDDGPSPTITSKPSGGESNVGGENHLSGQPDERRDGPALPPDDSPALKPDEDSESGGREDSGPTAAPADGGSGELQSSPEGSHEELKSSDEGGDEAAGGGGLRDELKPSGEGGGGEQLKPADDHDTSGDDNSRGGHSGKDKGPSGDSGGKESEAEHDD